MSGRDPLPFALARAAERLTEELVALLDAEGWPRLTRSHLAVLDALPGSGSHPAQLARDRGMTRQSMQQLLATLERAGLVRIGPRDDDRRSKTVQLTDQGRAMVAALRRHTRSLERDVARRVGRDGLEALHVALGGLDDR